MGTNYYLRGETCSKCGRSDEDFHIGKSSGGWVFNLRIYPELGINTFEDFIPRILDGTILDEYGDEVTIEELLVTIFKRAGPKSMIDPETPPYHAYDVCSQEFS